MTKPITIPFSFALATGNVPASNLDSDYTTIANAINDLGTYSAFGSEVGAANAYVINFTAGITISLVNGLTASFNPANSNTGASTINVGGTGVISIVRPDLTALQPGDISSGKVYTVIYNQTSGQWVLSSLYIPQATLLQTQASSGRVSLPFIGSGANPTIIEWGNVVVTTNTSGGGSITFQTAFPTNIWGTVLGIGDNNVSDLTIQGIESQRSLISQGFQIFTAGSAVTVTARVTYVAIGN